ncbi:MAG: DUF411 domain-containing protein [Gammaproteobacteria bacterium]|jgi:hypothetical protein|nr:DUF411 domain-containing protein [Gammaproteobacteria bacterium]MBU0769817.1 DUF411 domain-containing protein [Gammaproteobacteria bacterium]MBU0856596.1 DUF411 domain-containing protein [Gammaproteobacteria bacterium]MBU1847510.1 DUF411 domain-containing protein [Gammaproteobacteria bacterium]
MSHETRRRALLGIGVLAALAPLAVAAGGAAKPLVEVWKSPTCGCCKDWVSHLEANGFEVRTHDTGNAQVRARLGMPIRYGSCHTGRVAGYALEGHVPASEVKRLLKEKPEAVGLAVPAMPLGSPGMDGPEYGGRRDAYDVLLVRGDGSADVYRSYR